MTAFPIKLGTLDSALLMGKILTGNLCDQIFFFTSERIVTVAELNVREMENQGVIVVQGIDKERCTKSVIPRVKNKR